VLRAFRSKSKYSLEAGRICLSVGGILFIYLYLYLYLSIDIYLSIYTYILYIWSKLVQLISNLATIPDTAKGATVPLDYPAYAYISIYRPLEWGWRSVRLYSPCL